MVTAKQIRISTPWRCASLCGRQCMIYNHEGNEKLLRTCWKGLFPCNRFYCKWKTTRTFHNVIPVPPNPTSSFSYKIVNISRLRNTPTDGKCMASHCMEGEHVPHYVSWFASQIQSMPVGKLNIMCYLHLSFTIDAKKSLHFLHRHRLRWQDENRRL